MLWLKRAAAASCACAALLWAAHGQAQDRVLLLDSEASPRSGLAAALQIQLVDQAVVDVRHTLPEASVSQRIAAATALGEAHGSLLVVWSDEPVAQPDGSSEAILYAVSRSEGRALLQVVRVPGGSGPEVDRALALKVGEVLRELQRARATPEAPTLQLEVPHEYQEAPEPTWHLSPMAALGLAVAPQEGTTLGQWGVLAAVGPSLSRGSLRLEAALQLVWFGSVEAARSDDRVELTQLSPELLIRSLWRQGAIWLGAHAGLGVALFELQARTRSGREASVDASSVTWSLGADVEWPVSAALAFGLNAGFEARSSAQRLTVNGHEVTAIERLRPRFTLSAQVRP
jgi:hypothetical protein